VTFSRVLSVDKAPFAVTLALGTLGWFVTTIIANISDVVIVGVTREIKDKDVSYTLTNSSIKRSLSNAVFLLNCQNDDCLSEMGTNSYILQENLPPYAIQGNKICAKERGSAAVLISLPPGGAIRYQIRPKANVYPSIVFVGMTKSDCPTSRDRLDTESLWIIEGISLLLLFAEYYLHVLSVALIVAFSVLIYILFYHREEQGQDTGVKGEQT